MMMEWLRGAGTVSVFIAFIAICIWAYSGRRKADFERAAQLPFDDDTPFATDAHEETSP